MLVTISSGCVIEGLLVLVLNLKCPKVAYRHRFRVEVPAL